MPRSVILAGHRRWARLVAIAINLMHSVWVRPAPFLAIALGAIGGYMVVPMNALLQHRGHNLMGSGRSIAVQNFNEQACHPGPVGAFYSAHDPRLGLSVYYSIGDLWRVRGCSPRP